MDCRHTVPGWHRYVRPAADAAPIFAACRLLVKEGELASDPRSIACAYWGRQRECPLYDGPGRPAREPAGPIRPPAAPELPVDPQAVWPVRAPGTVDRMRLVLIGLGVFSTALLAWVVSIGLSALSGQAIPGGYVPLTVAAATVSIVTHVLATLRTWARR
jgi:hypothetical protein